VSLRSKVATSTSGSILPSKHLACPGQLLRDRGRARKHKQYSNNDFAHEPTRARYLEFPSRVAFHRPDSMDCPGRLQ
jgi:hypothetical protein